MQDKSRIVIPKVWRSELKSLVAFAVFSAASVMLTQKFPGSVITGTLFNLGTARVDLSLPLFSLLPVLPFLMGVLHIYNVRYVIDSKGLEARIGILGLNQKIIRVRYTDIRSAESDQTIVERLLNVGDVEVGTAATSEIEIIFAGVAAPQELQTVIQRERDRGLQSAQAE